LPSTEILDGSELRIVENARYFREKLASMDEASRNKLTAFILQHCYLVVVAVPTPQAARRIFTVLNARGLDLTATDILKADLLERVGRHREAALAREWEDIEEELGRERFVELFAHIRMIFEREKPRSALEGAFRKVVTPFDQAPTSFIAEILQPLSEAMQQLEKIAELPKAFGTEASAAVRSLNRIDNKDWVPPAILSLWLHRQGQISTEATAQLLIGLERVAYYLFVIRGDVNQRILRFADVMDEIVPRPGGLPRQLGRVSQSRKALSSTGPWTTRYIGKAESASRFCSDWMRLCLRGALLMRTQPRSSMYSPRRSKPAANGRPCFPTKLSGNTGLIASRIWLS
jgi:hypothetical protein